MIWVVVAGVLLFLFASKCHARWLEVISVIVIVIAGLIEILKAHG
ncbi:MAG TPA: hypothetical protein VIA06_00825 [Candidatus Dormibacteraeota bacterium]|jgi:hypothetical protein|nr:hypothetical protein [Candidatus Dormibacteraeota bacterium]